MAFAERCKSYVAPEEFVLGKQYCLSINPKQRFYNFQEFKQNIGDYLVKNLPGIWTMYVEISPIGKFHLHGIIEIKPEQNKTDKVLHLYLFLQKMSEEGIMSYKLGEQFEVEPDSTSTTEEVIPNEEMKKPQSWQEYITKQVPFWDRYSCKPRFTNKYKSGLKNNCFEAKPRPVRNPKKKSRMTMTELKELNEQLIRERDLINEKTINKVVHDNEPSDDNVITV